MTHDEQAEIELEWNLDRIAERLNSGEGAELEHKAILLHVDLHQLAFIDALKERMGFTSRKETCAVMFQLAFDQISRRLPEETAVQLMLEVDEHFAELESQSSKGKL